MRLTANPNGLLFLLLLLLLLKQAIEIERGTSQREELIQRHKWQNSLDLERTITPGPGEYQLPDSSTLIKGGTWGNFKPKTEIEQLMARANDTPGPGNYSVPNTLNKNGGYVPAARDTERPLAVFPCARSCCNCFVDGSLFSSFSVLLPDPGRFTLPSLRLKSCRLGQRTCQVLANMRSKESHRVSAAVSSLAMLTPRQTWRGV